MSTVSSTDGGYNYYQRNLTELEDDLRNQAKKNLKSQEEHLQEMEENYKKALQKKDKDLEETVKNIKDNMNETLSREREGNKNEVARIKNDTYDKFGRFQGNDADATKAQFMQAKEGWENQHSADQRLLKDLQEEYSKRSEEQNRRHLLTLDETVQAERNAANELYLKAVEEKKSGNEGYLEGIKNSYKNLIDDKTIQSNLIRRESEHAIEDTKADYDRQMQKYRQANEDRFNTLEQDHLQAISKAVKKTVESESEQNKTLRLQLNDLVKHADTYKKDKADGTIEAIKEQEKGWRTREQCIQRSYVNEIEDLKRLAKESEERSDFIKNEALLEKDNHFTEIVHSQNKINEEMKKDLLNIYNKDHEQMDERLRKEHEQAVQQNERIVLDLGSEREKALIAQAKAFNDTIQRNRESEEDKVKLLENQLNYKTSSGDASVISPAAEANLRKIYVNEYQKTADAEHASNRNALDSLQKEYSNRLYDVTTESSARENSINQRSAAELHHERSELLQHLQDMENMKQSTLNNQESDHRREVDNLNRNYSVLLDRQKKQYEEILDTTKNQLNAKMQEMRLDSDFNFRMAQREYASRQNEVSRDLEKKIMDQKLDYEAVLQDVKEESSRSLRDQERSHRLAMEEQVKLYEQKLTQQEMQLKERERVSAQNHEDELDKMRRAHSMMMQRRNA